MRQSNLSLNSILDNEFLETLAKSADLYKIGSNSILDPEEIRIGLKVVPRAVMSMLLSELTPLPLDGHKDIHLPFGKMARMSVNKNAADDYTGSVYDDNKLVYDFKNRSIPGLGIILLSTFELYNLEDLSKPAVEKEDIDGKVQKLIDQRMELHSLVNRVVEDKMSQREALHKLMMMKLNEALAEDAKKKSQIVEITKISEQSTPNPIDYHRGMTNGLKVAESIVTGKEPEFLGPTKKPLDLKPHDIAKREPPKKGSPLKGFLERKKQPKEYKVEIAKSEQVSCPDCGQTVFGKESGYSGCICFGQDQYRKIWLKKTDDGVQLKFSRGWDEDNISQLLELLRKNNGKH